MPLSVLARRIALLALVATATLGPAAPVLAQAWGHSSDEDIALRVKVASQRMTDPAFQKLLAEVNRQYQGVRVVRSGWVVQSYVHTSIPDLATVLVSNRRDRPGVTWTLYLPGHTSLRLQPGDQVQWEGVIRAVKPTGEIVLRNERVVRWISGLNPGVAEDWPVGFYRDNQPVWWFQSLAERPLILKVDPVVPGYAVQDGYFGDVRVRLWVSPPGHVARVEVARSSGRADVDAVVVDAVRRWKYQPFPPGRTDDQLGEVTVPIRAY